MINKENTKKEIINRLNEFMRHCYNIEGEDTVYVTCHVENDNVQTYKVHDMVKNFTIKGKNICGFVKNLYSFNNELYILFENNNTLNFNELNDDDIYTVIDFFQCNYFRDVV